MPFYSAPILCAWSHQSNIVGYIPIIYCPWLPGGEQFPPAVISYNLIKRDPKQMLLSRETATCLESGPVLCPSACCFSHSSLFRRGQRSSAPEWGCEGQDIGLICFFCLFFYLDAVHHFFFHFSSLDSLKTKHSLSVW